MSLKLFPREQINQHLLVIRLGATNKPLPGNKPIPATQTKFIDTYILRSVSICWYIYIWWIWSNEPYFFFSSFQPRPPLQRRFPLSSKPFELNLRYLKQRIYWSWSVHWMTFHDLELRPRLWHRLAKFAFLHDKVRTTHLIATNRKCFITLTTIIITWLDFGDALLQHSF